MQRCGEEDEEEEREEEGCTTHKLKEVKRATGSAIVHHFLQDKRHEWQELQEKWIQLQIKHFLLKKLNHSVCGEKNPNSAQKPENKALFWSAHTDESGVSLHV